MTFPERDDTHQLLPCPSIPVLLSLIRVCCTRRCVTLPRYIKRWHCTSVGVADTVRPRSDRTAGPSSGSASSASAAAVAAASVSGEEPLPLPLPLPSPPLPAAPLPAPPPLPVTAHGPQLLPQMQQHMPTDGQAQPVLHMHVGGHQ